MYVNRREIVQAGVRSFVVVEGEVTLQASRQGQAGVIVVQVDVFVLDRAPEPFDKHVIQRPSATIHADPHPRFLFLTDRRLTASISLRTEQDSKATKRTVSADVWLARCLLPGKQLRVTFDYLGELRHIQLHHPEVNLL